MTTAQSAAGEAMEVELAGPGAFAIDVVGVARHQDVLAAAAERAENGVLDAVLVLEDSNPYDSQAVQVQIEGRPCGYLSRENARLYRASLAAAGGPHIDVRCKARIVGGFELRDGERAHFGLRLDLPPLSHG